MSTPAGDDLVGNAHINVNANTDPALRALGRFSRDANGRLHDIRGRFVSESALINRSLTDAAGGGDRFRLSLSALAGAARGAVGILGRVGLSVGAIGAAAGTAAPLLAGIVTTLESIAPAGAVAVTGMLAVQQASAAIKLGMLGVEEAVTAAFDSSEAGAKKFDEALKKLAPNARAFALQVRELRPEFQKFQQGVQDRIFKGFDTELERLSSKVLPVVRKNLNDTATTLNKMAIGASTAARGLATDGTLGKAMSGASKGLSNLQKVPGQLVKGLGQLAAAGAPAFQRITKGAANAATSISDRLDKAFKSGALTKAVDAAVKVLKDLGTVAANVFGILRNVMAPVQAEGGGLVGVLKEITGALREATATTGFQQAISAAAQAVGVLARTVGPLLGQALAAVGPILTALGPPVERLVTNLGTALSPIIQALGPILRATAVAVGALVDALSPVLVIVGELVASILPPLTPVLTAITSVFRQAAPVILLAAQTLSQALAPVIAQLPALMTPFSQALTTLARSLFPALRDVITAIGPSLQQMGAAWGQLLVAVGPLLPVLAQLIGQHLARMIPVLTPIITLTAQLATVLLSQLASAITNVVTPAFQALAALMRGDFSAAWRSLQELVSGVGRHFVTTLTNVRNTVEAIVRGIAGIFQWLYNVLIGNSIVPDLVRGIAAWFGRIPGLVAGPLARFRTTVVNAFNAVLSVARTLPGRMAGALSALTGQITSVASRALASFRRAIVSGASSAVTYMRGVPGRLRSALGSVGSLLAGAGRDLISGMIGGIRSMAGSLVSAARGVVGSAVAGAKSLLGISSPSKVFREIGRDTGRGFIIGLTGTREQINRTATGIAGSITSAFRGRNTRVDDRLVALVQSGNRRLQGLAVERDRIAQRIADAQKFSTDLAQRSASAFSLSSLAGETTSESVIEAQLRRGSKAINDFAKNIRTLKAKGLSEGLLRQLLELGPEQGAGLAKTIAAQSEGYIRRINALQGNVTRASTSLGRLGADTLFDAGRQAGRGFLTGLRAQQKQIEQLMLSIAKGMQKAIRRALGIKSPSTVMAEVGRLSSLGLAAGLVDRIPAVRQAASRVAGSVAGTAARMGVPSASVGALGVGAVRTAAAGAPATTVIHLNFSNHGVLGSQLEVRTWLIREMDTLRRLGKLPSTQRGG